MIRGPGICWAMLVGCHALQAPAGTDPDASGSGSAGLLACGTSPRGPAFDRFDDVTAQTGMAFRYAPSDYRGGGLIIADLDGDGRPDLVTGNRAGGLALYRNRGGIVFEPVTTAGLDLSAQLSAGVAADLDNDGDLDLVLAGAGTASVMTNRGDGTFTLAMQLTGTGVTEQVLAIDLDGDGLLDLFFANREYPLGASSQNRVYLNGSGMQFTAAGSVGANALSWTATGFDSDGDGNQDVYVANDTLIPDFGPGTTPWPTDLPADALLRNDGHAVFTDTAAQRGMAMPRSSMSGVLGDLDGDGLLDIYITNTGAKKAMIRTGSDYVDGAPRLGLEGMMRVNDTRLSMPCEPGTTHESCLLVSWGAAFTDFDLDGRDELVVVNGYDYGIPPVPPLLFVRDGSEPDVTYREASIELGCPDARGLVATDLDGDGDQDLAIVQTSGPLLVMENRGTPAPDAWLDIRLHGTQSNREGIGAIVTAHLASGRILIKAVGSGGVMNVSAPADAYFGLGNEVVTSLEVQWPSGKHTSVTGPVDQRVTLIEP